MPLPLPSYLFGLLSLVIFTPLVIACPPLAQSQNNTPEILPNSVKNPTEIETPGWGKWQPIREIENANISAGFSNMELGGYEDFRHSCAEQTGMPVDSFPNWFRYDNLLNQIGTGNIEYGCWVEDKFISTITITAAKTDIEIPYCLEVIANNSINIYSESDRQSPQISILKPGEKIELTLSPALTIQLEGETWLMIENPQGWVVQGTPESDGNLRLCQ